MPYPTTATAKTSQLLGPPQPTETAREMVRFAVEAQKDVAFRDRVTKIVQKLFPRDYTSEIAALLNWVRLNIRYVRDPVQFERVQTPQVTLQQKSGDCDDLATLLAAMSTSLGHKSRFAMGGFTPQIVYTHIWCETFDTITKCWLVLDPVPGKNVGQMLGNVRCLLYVPVEIN